MPKYAGFKDLKDYITTRCREHGISFHALSEALGKTSSYVHAIATGNFKPSIKGADALASFFDDNPRIVRILAGLELPPTEDDKGVGEIKELAAGLPEEARRELVAYAGFLRQKYQVPAPPARRGHKKTTNTEAKG